MEKKHAIRERESDVINSGAVARLKLRIVPAGMIICYQRLSWEISIATALGNTRCRLVIEGHGYDIDIAEQQAPTAANLYWIHDSVWVLATERLALLVDQPQDGTIVKLNGIGYWVDEKEGVI